MQIVIKKQVNILSLMRQCGYYISKNNNNEIAFFRIISNSKSGFPRFHAYIKKDEISQETIINLHLDQKKPVYKGSSAHAAEYEGELVEKETERLSQILNQ